MNKLQKLLALLLAAAMVLAMVPAAAAETGTVTIADEAQFLAFAQNCARDTWSVGITAELTADLDLGGTGFTPIPLFQGTFHGNGHTISGLSFTGKGSRVGLFRTLTASAEVTDLRVDGRMAPEGTASQVGLLAGENHGLIRGCTVSGAVSGQEDVGAVAGLNGEDGRIEACASSAAVSGVTNTGGIVGQNLGTVSGCTNTGDVDTAADQETPTSVGGIAGLSRGVLTDCANEGAVGYDHLGYNVGGIAGLQSGEIQNCVNTGTIRGRKDVGGIVGQFEPLVRLDYGTAPTDALSASLSALLEEMETFADEVSDMAAQGVADAQAISDALAVIRDEAHNAAATGGTNLKALAEDLDDAVTDLGSGLEGLRNSTGAFTSAIGTGFDTILQELKDLRRDLGNSGSTAEIQALLSTLDQLHTQVKAISDALSAMAADRTALETYLNTVLGLLEQGDLEGALSQPLPDLDISGHAAALGNALTALPDLLTRLSREWSALAKALPGQLQKDWKRWNQAQTVLFQQLQALADAGDRLQTGWGASLDQVSSAVSGIRQLLRDYAAGLSDRAQSTVDAVDAQLTIIESRLSGITGAAADDNTALHDVTVQMIQSLDAARQALSQLGREPQLTVTDGSADTLQGPGLIGGCTVAADIAGDSCVGGIVGIIAPELGDDPEATFDVGDLKLTADVAAHLTAVVRDCRFDGAVAVKNDCGGGIAGHCTAGALVDCAARGDVNTGTDYCGGIVGRTRGSVIRCAALTDLTGGSWVGGIAGLGGDLTDCRAMVRADSDGECVGAVAGAADGTLAGNRYLLEDVYGVDGVDYAGTAEGLDFAGFSALDGIPADFLTFSYRFVADGVTVAEIPFSYGGDLDMAQVPQAPERDGQYGQWPDFPTEDLTRSLVLEAQFEAPTTTLSDGGDLPELLAVGTFPPDAALTVSPLDLPDTGLGTAQKAWDYAVSGAAGETVSLRLRAAGLNHPAAAVLQDGTWVLAEGAMDGSYLVIEAPAAGQVVLLERSASMTWLWCLAAGLVLVVLAAAVLLRKRHRKAVKA